MLRSQDAASLNFACFALFLISSGRFFPSLPGQTWAWVAEEARFEMVLPSPVCIFISLPFKEMLLFAEGWDHRHYSPFEL